MKPCTFFHPFHAGEFALNLTQGAIQRLHNGLFRCPLPLASELMPELASLFENAPVFAPEEWEVDVKVHMLMKNQYPCIPNWHCDNVPRGADGQVDYTAINDEAPPMLLWVSDGPETEFLSTRMELPEEPGSHLELAQAIRHLDAPTERILPQNWYSMTQRTPHRGTKAEADGWRVFVRLTHRSIAPDRPVLSYMRRHSQVYLDATQFSW